MLRTVDCPSSSQGPFITCGGVGEVMEGPWVGVGPVLRVGDLTGWPLLGRVQKSWNTCWALSISGTFEGGFEMTAGECVGEGSCHEANSF